MKRCPAWIHRLSDGRKAADLLRPDSADDLADPYGLEQRHYDAMVAEVSEAVDVLAGDPVGRSVPSAVLGDPVTGPVQVDRRG